MTDLFLAVVRGLRAALPCSMPVKVKRRSITDDLGITSKREDHYLIEIDSKMCLGGQLMVLCHEWGHARAWDLEDEDRHHCGHWGIEAAKAYIAGKKIWNAYENW